MRYDSELNRYSIFSGLATILDILVIPYMYFFDKELRYIWQSDSNIIIKSFNTLAYDGYMPHLIVGVVSIIITGYLLIALVRAAISNIDSADIWIVILILLLVIFICIIGYLLYNPIILALLVCLGVAFAVVSAYS
ncbi:hypothetical protein [Ligilactobacillus murinus]|uniref:hypothetical protein n=1 Tax=Ligilactobacillus murinus TaxID=1622 RepID=UPI0010943371|nr:hypothetical protein [Ligilactobacillus murinus]TGY53933.1 hypothetical protein E5341_00535 [Ligilactobacillus murinus]